jgi:hypothetical protein
MKNLLLIFVLFLNSEFGICQFNTYFDSGTLRMDYIISGNSNVENFAFKQFKKEEFWGGSQKNLIEDFEYGQYLVKVFDKESGKLIYSRGYGSLFQEWSATEEAKLFSRSFEETVVLPFPKVPVIISVYSRNSRMLFDQKFTIEFDPAKTFCLIKNDHKAPSIEILNNKDASRAVDIVVLPEGYTADEIGKFLNDCKTLVEQMFSFQPFTDLKSNFNVHAVWVASEETGCDDPNAKKEVSTPFNASFNTLYSDRYCMTLSNHDVRDYAANAPYDQIYILVNTEKYGGGGIYNYYSVSVSGNLKSPKVFIHEFGHSFAGLADEYAYEDSFEDIYDKDTEPWEPNITTLVNFDKKWKNMVDKGTKIPSEVSDVSKAKLGAYEGAGYVKKGVFRPLPDCMMRSFEGDIFCPVCDKAIRKMTAFYSE